MCPHDTYREAEECSACMAPSQTEYARGYFAGWSDAKKGRAYGETANPASASEPSATEMLAVIHTFMRDGMSADDAVVYGETWLAGEG